MNTKASEELYTEAQYMFPGGVHSPVRAFKSVSGTPLFIKEGKGAKITDEDDNTYIDFCCSWGPLILGHAHPHVIQEVEKTLRKGTSFGTPSIHGNRIGQMILDNHQYIDKMRFVNSGTEAVMSAIRLARGYTGKNKIIKFEGCYHGHVDSLMVKAGSGLATFNTSTSAGIPPEVVKDTIVLPLNDKNAVEEAYEEYGDEIAGIIIEGVPANNGLLIQDKEYMHFLRKISETHDSLLIMDEVITGFRLGFEGASSFYDLQADIYTYGKIIGGGMPVGAYAASNEIMSYVAPDGPVYQAGTLSANPVAMTAGIATLEVLLGEDFYNTLEKRTEKFVSRLKDYAEQNEYPLSFQHIGSIFWLNFSNSDAKTADDINETGEEYFKNFHKNLLEKGIYFGPSAYEVGFISLAHGDSILDEAYAKMTSALDKTFAEAG